MSIFLLVYRRKIKLSTILFCLLPIPSKPYARIRVCHHVAFWREPFIRLSSLMVILSLRWANFQVDAQNYLNRPTNTSVTFEGAHNLIPGPLVHRSRARTQRCCRSASYVRICHFIYKKGDNYMKRMPFNFIFCSLRCA